jgi:hypothetical protein
MVTTGKITAITEPVSYHVTVTDGRVMTRFAHLFMYRLQIFTQPSK